MNRQDVVYTDNRVFGAIKEWSWYTEKGSKLLVATASQLSGKGQVQWMPEERK